MWSTLLCSSAYWCGWEFFKVLHSISSWIVHYESPCIFPLKLQQKPRNIQQTDHCCIVCWKDHYKSSKKIKYLSIIIQHNLVWETAVQLSAAWYCCLSHSIKSSDVPSSLLMYLAFQNCSQEKKNHTMICAAVFFLNRNLRGLGLTWVMAMYSCILFSSVFGTEHVWKQTVLSHCHISSLSSPQGLVLGSIYCTKKKSLIFCGSPWIMLLRQACRQLMTYITHDGFDRVVQSMTGAGRLQNLVSGLGELFRRHVSQKLAPSSPPASLNTREREGTDWSEYVCPLTYQHH